MVNNDGLFETETPIASSGAIVLCGGKSERMGRDKATLRFGETTFLQHIVAKLLDLFEPNSICVVKAKGQSIPHLPSGVNITEDAIAERGPLEGLAAGLRAMPVGVKAVFACSCDAPFINEKVIKHLFSLLVNVDAVLPRDNTGLHPLCGIYHRNILPSIEQQLLSNRLSMRSLLECISTKEVSTELLQEFDRDLRFLWNVNAPTEYENALAILEAIQSTKPT